MLNIPLENFIWRRHLITRNGLFNFELWPLIMKGLYHAKPAMTRTSFIQRMARFRHLVRQVYDIADPVLHFEAAKILCAKFS